MTTDTPLFSIITVTKNNLRGLNATWGSVKAQSFKDYEWIVIDGLSDDGTKDLLSTLPAHTLSEADNGIYDAMNKGAGRARGDYIIFLNAGDLFADPDILSTLFKAIRAESPDFIYGDALETGGFYKKARHHTKIDWGMITHHQAMLYRRDLIHGLQYDTKLQIAADYAFTTAFLTQVKNIHYIPCAICIFEEGGISQKNRLSGRQEQFTIRMRAQTCSPGKNIVIYAVQTLSAFLRTKYPALYFRLRHSPENGQLHVR